MHNFCPLSTSWRWLTSQSSSLRHNNNWFASVLGHKQLASYVPLLNLALIHYKCHENLLPFDSCCCLANVLSVLHNEQESCMLRVFLAASKAESDRQCCFVMFSPILTCIRYKPPRIVDDQSTSTQHSDNWRPRRSLAGTRRAWQQAFSSNPIISMSANFALALTRPTL